MVRLQWQWVDHVGSLIRLDWKHDWIRPLGELYPADIFLMVRRIRASGCWTHLCVVSPIYWASFAPAALVNSSAAAVAAGWRRAASPPVCAARARRRALGSPSGGRRADPDPRRSQRRRHAASAVRSSTDLCCPSE